jgi:hypothetical protein
LHENGKKHYWLLPGENARQFCCRAAFFPSVLKFSHFHFLGAKIFLPVGQPAFLERFTPTASRH